MARKSRKNITTMPDIASNLLKTAVYIRLSVEDNKNRGNSVDTQKQIIENFIAITPELEIYDSYIDNGLTGRNFDRPEFNRMLDDIEKGRIQCVVVKDLSRLGRNSISTGYYVEKHFPLRGVRFIAVNDNFDTANDFNNGSGIILPLKNMINEAYSMDIAKKIKAQQQQAMREGQFVGARPPYGYKKSPEDCHKLVIDEVTAPVVKRIFEMSSEGVGLAPICRALNEDNILPPSQYAQSQGIISHKNLLGNGNWQTRTLMKILSSEVYMGDLVQGKSKSVNRKQMPNSEDKWIIVKDTHEPIIDRALFAKVQEIRAEKSEKKSGEWTENIFKGKIVCGYTDVIQDFSCYNLSITEQEISNIIFQILRKQAEVIFALNEVTDTAPLEFTLKQQDLYAKQIADMKALKTRLYEQLMMKEISLDEYKQCKDNIDVKLTLITNSYNNTTQRNDQLLRTQEEKEKRLSVANKITVQKSLTKELVDLLIDKVSVFPNNQIEIAWKIKDFISY